MTIYMDHWPGEINKKRKEGGGGIEFINQFYNIF